MNYAQQTSSYQKAPRAIPFTVLACLVTSALFAVAVPAATQQTFKGRKVADVMSFRGAAWLERAERQQEEDSAALLELLPVESGDVVVDMGCGSGYYARQLSALVGPEGKVLCVDIQPEMLEIAEMLAEREGLTNLEYVLGTTTDPKLPSEGIDLILLVDVYHEFSDPKSMLEAMRASLKPDGIAALAEYRLEGETAAWIKRDHRMSIDQVKKEWLPAGFQLDTLHESLPSQHLFFFGRAD